MMAPTIQQFPQPVSVFYTAPGVPGHLPDGTMNFHKHSQLEFPSWTFIPPGLAVPRKLVTTVPLHSELEEKEKLESAASFAPPPAAPWKKPLNNSNEPPVMINGIQAFKKTSPVVQISPLRTAFIPTPNELTDLTSNLPVSKDAEFQKNQLVPKLFLSEPLWSQLVPSNFVTRAHETHLSMSSTCLFVLEPQPGKILFRPIHFVVTVTGPRDHAVPIQMRIDSDETGKELRYIYCFRPQKPGTYVAKVRLAASGLPHVCQSPLKFHVTQNQPSYTLTQYLNRGSNNNNNNSNPNNGARENSENRLPPMPPRLGPSKTCMHCSLNNAKKNSSSSSSSSSSSMLPIYILSGVRS